MKHAWILAVLVFSQSPAAWATVEEGKAAVKPWSGYWWPLQKGELANGYAEGSPAPLQKHDQVTGKKATEWEREHHVNPDAEKWEGHCNGWAAASILEPEPVRPVTHGGVEFRVGDIKALLTMAHQHDSGVVFGERYTGPDSDPADLPPDRVWSLCRKMIGERRLPLLMDLKNDEEVWTYPVFAYRVEYYPSEPDPDIFIGLLTLTAAASSVPPDFVGTEEVERQYLFRVWLDEGRIVMGSGRWLGRSEKDHPDFAWFPQSQKTDNPELDLGLVATLAKLASRPERESDRIARRAANLSWCSRASVPTSRLPWSVPPSGLLSGRAISYLAAGGEERTLLPGNWWPNWIDWR